MSASLRHAAVAAAGVTFLVFGAACSTRSAPADAPRKQATTVNEAEAEFEQAEQALGDMMLTTEPPVAPPPPPASPDGAPHPQPPQLSMGGADAHEASADRCTRACSALASMKRSADRVCELTGDEDARCKSVRARVDAARTVVRSACPDCEA